MEAIPVLIINPEPEHLEIEEYCHVGYESHMSCMGLPTFRMNLLLPSLWSKSKPSKQRALLPAVLFPIPHSQLPVC
jgi:hypothetical protein